LYKKILNKKIDLSWIFFSVFSRAVPLSVIPLLIGLVDKKEVDWFVLIQTNASLLAIFFGFSQGSYIQRKFSNRDLSAAIILTASVPILLLIITIGVVLTFTKDYFFWMYTLILSFCIAYIPQTQALLQTTKRFSLIVIADFCRILFYFGCILFLYMNNRLTAKSMVWLLSLFYLLPFLFLYYRCFLDINIKNISGAINEWFSSFRWMGMLAFSSLISIAAWMSIRYSLSVFGQIGELSNFAAIMSVASMCALVVDLIYIRCGKSIIYATQARNIKLLLMTAKKVFVLTAISSIAVTLVSVIYVNFQFGKIESKYFISTIIINIGYHIRGIYIFAQYILTGMGLAKFDFLSSILMLTFSLLSAKWLTVDYGLVGASVLFMSISAICLLVLTFGVVKHWKKPWSSV